MKTNRQRGFERGEIMLVAKLASVSTQTVRKFVDGDFNKESPTLNQMAIRKAIDLLSNFKKNSVLEINNFKNEMKGIKTAEDHVLI